LLDHYVVSIGGGNALFEITVFSNPVNALVGEGGFLHGDELHRTVEYDEVFVKPALLLADKVTLRSHRVDLITNQIRDHNMLAYPVPLISQSVGISKRRDPTELAILGIAEQDLLSQGEVEEFSGLTGFSDEDWRRAIERCQPFKESLASFFRRHGESMTSPILDSMSDIIQQLPWDPRPKTQPQKLLDNLNGENAEFERAFMSMADDVARSPVSVMLDDTVSADLSRFADPAAEFESAATVRGAVDLMRMVGGVSEMPLDEIAGVRSELAPYLSPFRSFLIDVASSVDLVGVDDAERSRRLVLSWEREVQPAVDELEATLRSASFRNNAIDVFASEGETLKTVAVAIGVATASGLIGISSLTAVGALAPPLLKAFIGSVRAKQSARTNRAYFVHSLGGTMRAVAKRRS
jgi:hypothetical protein